MDRQNKKNFQWAFKFTVLKGKFFFFVLRVALTGNNEFEEILKMTKSYIPLDLVKMLSSECAVSKIPDESLTIRKRSNSIMAVEKYVVSQENIWLTDQ